MTTTTNGNDTGERETSPGERRAVLVAQRAYEKWQARGCPEGDDRRDWFEAEQEVPVDPSPAPSVRPRPTEASRSRNRATP
jgi:hypothetical protein